MKFSRTILLAITVPGIAVLSGQSNRGSLTGTVSDVTGAAVPEAQVMVANTQTGTRYEAQTSASGVYTVAELPFGAYAVSVSKTGFRTAQVKEITITVNQVTRLDVSLEVGEVRQSVEVTATAVALQQDTATVQTNYNRKFMSELPLALGTFSLRAPESFTFLTPGVVGSTWNNTINGGQTFANEVLLDGASTGRTWHPGNFDESAPSVDALGEFSIKTNAFSAEYGRTGSAITSFAYKSGTNDPHGSLYYFLRNEAVDAKGFYRQNTSDRKHDFGGTLGGPVYLPKLYNGRNRTFFFFSFEAFLTNRLYTASPQTVPTALQRQGDFSELLKLRNPVQVYHPIDATPYPGNLLPRSQWSKASSYGLQFIPAASLVEPGTGLTRWYNVGVPTTLRNNLETLVLDHNFTQSQRFHYSWSRRNNHRFRDPENLIPMDNPFTRMRDQIYTTNQWRATLDTVFTPTFLNHLNLGIDRVKSSNFSVTHGMNFVKNSGLLNVANSHTPALSIGGYLSLSVGEGNVQYDTRWELADSVTWVRGKHTLKLGGEARRTRYNFPSWDNSGGSFNFSATQTATLAGVGGDGFASYLLGAASSGSKKDPLLTPGWRFLYTAAFVQDDWKATARLTINLGMRWEVDFPRVEVRDRTSGLNMTMPNPLAGNIPGALEFATEDRRHFDTTAWKSFGPRFGLAYSLTKQTIVRTGYGLNYNNVYYDGFGAGLHHGFEATPSFTSPNGRQPAFFWDNGFPDNYRHAPYQDAAGQNRQGIDFIAADTRLPYIQSWNFGLQQQVTANLNVEAFYVGTKGTRLARPLNLLQTRPERLALGDLLQKRIDDPAVAAAGFKSPYPNFIQDWGSGATLWRALRPFPQFNSINWINSQLGNSTYHSLQVKVEQRFSHGLQFLLAYTWSKNITDAEAATRTGNGFRAYQNDWLGRKEKSLSGVDFPHVLAASFLYEIPIGRDRRLRTRGVLDRVAGGWQLTGTARYSSGSAMTISATCASLSLTSAGSCRASFTGVSDLLGPGKDRLDPDSGLPYLNAAAFTVPAPYAFGDTPRVMGNLRWRPGMTESLGLFKRTRLDEHFTLQIRAEAFNAFNRVMFNQPNRSLGSYDPARPGNINRNQNFGFFSGQSNDPRIVQLAMKLEF